MIRLSMVVRVRKIVTIEAEDSSLHLVVAACRVV
jgi:hypothetical protein